MRISVALGAALAAALSAPAFADCGQDMQKLAQARNVEMQKVDAFAKSFRGKPMDPAGFCAKTAGLLHAEDALIAYMVKNKDWCSFPDEAINNLKASHAKNAGFNTKACNVAAQIKKMKEQAAQGGGAAGAAVARRTALSAQPERTILPDARPSSLVLKLTPNSALPFVQLARLDRPAGWQLLLAPCWQGTALAGLALHRGPNPWHLVLFLIGAIVMRGAGSTYNDILDRKLDAGVERTRGRPLPSGRAGVRAAAAFMVAQSLVGLAVLLCFNPFSIVLGIASLAIVAVYPLMKRVTSWPQAVLGLAFSWGALMGWAATFASLAAAPVAPLFLRVRLDDRLRHDLRPAGRARRRHRRDSLDGAALCGTCAPRRRDLLRSRRSPRARSDPACGRGLDRGRGLGPLRRPSRLAGV